MRARPTRRRSLPIPIAVLAVTAAVAAAEPPVVLDVPRVPRPPVLEEFLDMEPPDDLEDAMAKVSGGLVQRDPEDGEPASQHTDVYLGYDDDHLYAVFVAFDDDPSAIRANVARRESIQGDDIVEIQLDTFLDHRRAYTFISNPVGVQWDAVWTEGREFDASFDTVWYSRGRLTERGYVVWMSIPFKSLRFPPGVVQRWGFFLVRDIPRNNESSFFPPMTTRIEGRLNQEGVLRGMEGISAGRNLRLIPYATARSYRVLDDRAPEGAKFRRDDADADAGLDAKLVVGDRMVLDLTANPDFSQVESDEAQVTVNQRFEVFFPEKRPFFLENAETFQTPVNLVFTRRILDPRLGARLTGKLGAWSLGAMLVEDEGPGKAVPVGDPRSGRDAGIGIVRLNRDVGVQSTVGVLLADRDWGGTGNRVASLDARVKLTDHWVATAQAAAARTRRADGDVITGPALDLVLDRASRHFTVHTHWFDIGRDFRSDLGFVPRTDVREYHQNLRYAFRPEAERLLAWIPGLFVLRSWDHEGTRLDEEVRPSVEWELRGQTGIGLEAGWGRERIRSEDFPATDPATGLPVLTEDADFAVSYLVAFVESQYWQKLSLSAVVFTEREINFVPPPGEPPRDADGTGCELEITMRPTGRLRIDLTYLLTRLSGPGGEGRIFTNHVLRTRAGYQFTPRLSLRAIVRYDTTRAVPGRTSLRTTRNWNGDLLLTYLVNPWTAVYAGFNTNLANVGLEEDDSGALRVVRTPTGLRNDARQLFVKLSYLFSL